MQKSQKKILGWSGPLKDNSRINFSLKKPMHFNVLNSNIKLVFQNCESFLSNMVSKVVSDQFREKDGIGCALSRGYQVCSL